MEVREIFFDILASLTAIMTKFLFVSFNKYTGSSKSLLNEHELIWKKERNFSSWANFSDWIWSILKYLEFTTFVDQFFALGKNNFN